MKNLIHYLRCYLGSGIKAQCEPHHFNCAIEILTYLLTYLHSLNFHSFGSAFSPLRYA